MSTSIHSTIMHRGCSLSYTISGDGPPVLFIQGTGLHGDGWQPQVATLADQYSCLTFDNRGMGRSQPIGAPVSVAQMAEDTRVLLDTLGWTSAHVVSHSLGGLIALQLALSDPGRVRSLALLCTFANGRDALPLAPASAWITLRMRVGPRRWRRHAFLELVMPPDVLAEGDRDAIAADLAPIFGHDLAEQPPVVMRQISAMRAYDATARLNELAGLPTLVVSAAHDRVAPPRVGRALANGIPGATFVEIPEAAHGVTIQRADQINMLLHEHFAQAKRSLALV